MPERTRKPFRAAQIQPGTVNQTRTALQDLPEKEKELFSLQEAIYQLRDLIKAALGKRYSYQEIATMLRQQGISISVSTLKRYLALGRQGGHRSTISSKLGSRNSENLSTQLSRTVEVFIPAKAEIASVTVERDFWDAYQASLKEREEVYCRLAES